MQKRDTILLVDDVEMNRVILGGLFKDEYHILEAENGEQALLLLKQNHGSIAVMLLDVVMPVKDGYQVLEEIQENGLIEEVPVVVITADDSLESELRAFDLGASDIIVKPFEPHVVTRRVRNIVELSQHRHNLESLVEEQAAKLRESNEILVDTLSSVIEYRSLESGLHIRRIRLLIKVLLKAVEENCPEYGLDARRIDQIADAAAMHDIGKIAIPDSILNKPGRLTTEEFEIMKTHTVKGCEILKHLDRLSDQDYLRYAYNICRYHHERWDGRGYPDGLVGDAIPICAQAAGIADAYDALTSDRVYKKALPHEQAASMILNGECGAFSPKLLECFKSVLAQFAELVRRYADGTAEVGSAASGLSLQEPAYRYSALQTEQMKYQALLRHLNATVVEADFSNGSYQLVYTCHPELRRLFDGRAMEAVIWEHVPELVHPDDVERIRRIWSDGLPRFFEDGLLKQTWSYRARLREGDWEWCEATVLRVDTEHPHQRKVIVLWQRQRGGAAAAEDRGGRNPLSVLRSAMDGVFCCRNDRWFTLEQTEEGFLGYAQRELAARFENRYCNLIHPDDRERVRAQLMAQLRDGTSYALEYRVCRADGVRWMLCRGELQTAADGSELLYGMLIDIDRSKRDQAALRMSLERYRIILEQTNDIIFEWEIETDQVTYSANWKKRFGYEAIRDRASERIPTVSHLHPDDMPAFAGLIEKMRGGTKYAELDFRVSNAGGRYQWCRIRATAQYDEAGRPQRVIGLIVDINEAMRATRELQAQSERDALTRLYNKAAARQKIEEFLGTRSPADGAAFLLIDIDDFKQVNDRYGHMFGDAVLGKIAERISSLFRGGDVVARIGGDEFLVLLRATMDEEHVRMAASRVVNCFRQTLLDIPAECHIACSVGISRCPEDGVDFQTLFQRADVALYRAKSKGKNQFQMYDSNMEGESYSAFPEPTARTRIDSDQYNPIDVTDLLPRVVRIMRGSQKPEQTVRLILELVGRRLGVSRTYVFERVGDGERYDNTYEWCADGVEPQKEKLRDRVYADLPISYQSLFNEHGVFYCDDIAALPNEVRVLMERQGVRSLLQCAIRCGGRFCGWVGLDDCENRFLWTQSQIDVLSFIAELLALYLLQEGQQSGV